MRKLLALLLLVSVPAMANGPIFLHKETQLQQEFENVYGDIGGVQYSSKIKGTITNNNAATGYIGEYVASVVSLAGAISIPASNTYVDVTSITLTPGDWDISASYRFVTGGAGMASSYFGISTTSGNSNSGLVNGDNLFNGLPPVAAYDSSFAIPAYRQSISATTTYYMKATETFSSGTIKVYGKLTARRVR